MICNCFHNYRKKKKAEGYPTGETMLYRPVPATDFIKSSDYIELLGNTSSVSLLRVFHYIAYHIKVVGSSNVVTRFK